MKRGEIYLINFGKIRPALIIQNDVANRNIDKVAFKGVSLIPLTAPNLLQKNNKKSI